jgi:hypothetical protein
MCVWVDWDQWVFPPLWYISGYSYKFTFTNYELPQWRMEKTRSDMIINTKKCWHVEGREIFTDIMRAQLRKRSGNWPPKMVSCSQQSLPYWLYCYNKPALDLSIHPLIILKTMDHASVSTCLLIPTNTAFVQSFITTVVFCRTPDQSPCHSSLPASIDLSHSCQLSLHFLAQGNDKV